MVLVDASNEYLRAVLTPEQWTAIVAISGGAPPVADYPEMERFDYDTLSDALERAVAALVPNARQMIATESGHVIQLEQPALVIEAIRQAVEGVRQPATWSDLVDCCAS